MLGLNIFQAYYALRHPPPPFPPLDSPAKRAQPKSAPPTPVHRPLNVTSAKVRSPSFSFTFQMCSIFQISLTQSTSPTKHPFLSTSVANSASNPTAVPTSLPSYQPSPLSSPSRIVNYKPASGPFPSPSPLSTAKSAESTNNNNKMFDTSVNSNLSNSSFNLSSPSPVMGGMGGHKANLNFSMSSPLAGYTRGRNARMSAARACFSF